MGIYLIQNVITGERYVGSSRDVYHRRNQHFSELQKGVHRNNRIQSSYNQYGKENFIFNVLEDVENKDDLVLREQYWLDTINPEYNLLKTANNNTLTRSEFLLEKYKRHGDLIRGKKASEETKKKQTLGLLEYWATPGIKDSRRLTQDQKNHLSEVNTGKNNPNWGLKRTPEQLENMSKGRANVKHTFRSPTGELVEIVNPYKNSMSLTGLSFSSIRNLYGGKLTQCQGWTFVKSEKIK